MAKEAIPNPHRNEMIIQFFLICFSASSFSWLAMLLFDHQNLKYDYDNIMTHLACIYNEDSNLIGVDNEITSGFQL